MLNITIQSATSDDAPAIAGLLGELLNEITKATQVSAFNFSHEEATARAADFLEREKYFVFLAHHDMGGKNHQAVGFVALYESHALYAEGAFGTIPELYVRPEFRSGGVGGKLVEQAREFGTAKGWKRLEVTTPPLPEFERTLKFYEREGFAISGGRKLRALLP